MPKQLNFYMDDSGSRRPNRIPLRFDRHRPDFFALGGILIDEEDEPAAKEMVDQFRNTWAIDYPLHSVEIRNSTDNFTWLRREEIQYARFMDELTQLLLDIPVLGLACTIDRPGYDSRYREKYGRRQWHLCKTAFSIVVERSCKEAILRGAKLNVYPERCSKADDDRLREWWNELRENGHPFDATASAVYAPLSKSQLATTLYDLKFKQKSSPMVQVADLYLWPICRGGYDANYRPYKTLVEHGKLIDCRLKAEERLTRGCKYSCFDLVKEGTDA